MMNKIFALAAVTATTTTALVAPDSLTHSLTHSDVDVDKFEKRLGFGRQHLQRRQHGHKALRADACQNVTEFRFSQAVQDNFAPIEEQSHWVAPGQRYWVNEELWGGAGFPIFVFIGGEWQESCSTLSPTGLYMYELAEQHKGLLVNVEHRFYGDSFPFDDSSTASLAYLSSQQALADLARLLAYVKTSYKTETSQIITVGGSYSGNLAAWFSVKYPAMTDGSVASSGPILAETNFTEYMDVVADSLEFFEGNTCVYYLQLAAEAVASLANEGVGSAGYTQLDTDFATCSPMASENDLSILLSDLMGYVQGTVQYNKAKPGSFNITTVCDVMLDVDGDRTPYDQFVTLAGMYRADYGLTCEDASWEDTVDYLAATQNDGDNSGRPWTYQTCNEFGYFQTTDSTAQPFKSWTWLGLQFYRDLCFAAFDGWTSLPQDDWMNTVYGGLDIDATNVIFPSGSIDPWHALGVTQDMTSMPQDSEIPLFIVGTSHCADLPTPTPYDPQSLTDARVSIASAVSGWLSGEDTSADSSGDDDDDSFLSSDAIIVGVIGVVIGFVFAAVVGGVYTMQKNKSSDSLDEKLI